jgi:hypothetical protein
MNEIQQGTCLSCLGSGEVSSERGLARCPDCDGTGEIGSVFRRNEQRMRQIEARMARLEGEARLDAMWLISELRRCREALLKVMTAAQDGDDGNDLLRRVQFEANQALGMYSPSSED